MHTAGGSSVFAGLGPCVRAVGAHVAVLLCLCHPWQCRPGRLLERQCRARLRRGQPAVSGLSMAAIDAMTTTCGWARRQLKVSGARCRAVRAWRLAGVHGRGVAWRGETCSCSSACIGKACLAYADVRHVSTSCPVSNYTCHQPGGLCAGLEELQPERGLAVLSALLSCWKRALAVPHWVASPLAADRLMHSRPHLADALSTLPQRDAVTLPEQHLVPQAHEPGERKHAAAPPASAELAADISAQLAALAAHVMGGPVSTEQPLMEVCVMVVHDLHDPPSVHRSLLEPVM